MQLEPQVTFKNVSPSDAILDQIHDHLGRLERKFPAIRCCQVVFERPQQCRRGEDRFRLDLMLTLTGGLEVAVNRDAPDFGREDPTEAVRDAFEITERRVAHALARRGPTTRDTRSVVEERGRP
jgi:ribosome-associated translation inhibitor RaiA